MIRRIDFFAIGFLIALPFVYFWQITLAQGVWFGNDIVRTYHPLGVELLRALNEGRIPLWTTGMYGGFPVLADAQIGALYPVNLLLFRLLPAHFALSYSMLLHLAWAGAGMYLLARAFDLRVSAALLAGLVFSFSGFMFSRLAHVTVLFSSAWLPWLIYCYEQFQRARAQKSSRVGVWFALTTITLGIQFLCGFPQVAFMNTLTFALFAFLGPLLWHSPNAERISVRSIRTLALPIVLVGVLALGVAAAQIIPTAELVGHSVRAGPSDFEFVTSYSLPVEFLPQFVFPFLHGEPSEGANNEYWAYIGIAPFALALLAIFLCRDRRTIFFTLFALSALSLALGDVNPAYRLIYQLPGFNLFRVPARYLLLFVFAATLLGASAFDALSNRLAQNDGRWKRAMPWGAALALLTMLSIGLAETQPIEFWLSAWQVLPFIFVLTTLGILLFVWKRRVSRATFQTIVLGLVLLDLTSLAPLFVKTLGQITAPSYVTVVPRSLAILEERPARERVFTDQYIFPSVPAIRGSLYPNTALLYGKESAIAYSSLASARHSAYLGNLSPAMLNVLNVRYWMIPLEPRFETKLAIPSDRVALDVLSNEEIIPPTMASAIEIASFTERAENLVDGTPVGQIDLRRRDGRIDSFPLRVGIETADWDYERKQAPHRRAQIAHSFPGFWRSFGRAFEGHTYVARFDLEPNEIVGVNVRVLQPKARLTVEGITLYNAPGQSMSLAKLVNKNDFQVAYFSDTVAAWKNLDAMPRAFIVHSAEIADDDSALARLREPGFDPARSVLLAEGSALNTAADSSHDAVEIVDYKSERVSISVTTDQPGYLILADSWYPGWNAFVDGQPAPIYRADILFRAVRIEPGTHTVVFEYRPMSFVLGAVISIISLLILAGVALFYFRSGKQ